MAHFSREVWAHSPQGTFLSLKFSEMQSSVFWPLKFSKCLDVMLNYLIKYMCGYGQRSN